MPDRLDNTRSSLLLAEVAAGARMQHALGEKRFLGHGADQDSRAARMGRESPDELETAALRQGQVDDGEVRRALAEERLSLGFSPAAISVNPRWKP
jgi:hypothetical protein